MNDIKLLAVDIDGTLINSKRVLTEKTVCAVKKLLDKGGKFVLSTGRPYQGITEIVKTLGLEGMPYILYNGAMVVTFGKPVYSLTIEPELSKKIAREGHDRNSTQICWANNKLYSEKYDEKIEFYKSISGVEPIIVKDLTELSEQGITKFVWYDDPVSTKAYYAQMSERYGNQINLHPSRVDFLEFVNKDCSKATALKTVLNYYGLSRENCAAIGDGFNDLSMLEYAGISVAMGNAEDEVKARCKVVTSSCDQDGVAEFIERFVL